MQNSGNSKKKEQQQNLQSLIEQAQDHFDKVSELQRQGGEGGTKDSRQAKDEDFMLGQDVDVSRRRKHLKKKKQHEEKEDQQNVSPAELLRKSISSWSSELLAGKIG